MEGSAMAGERADAIAAALDWVLAHRQEFALPKGPINEETLRELKPLGELVLVAEKLARQGSQFSAVSNDILSWAWAEVSEGELLLHILGARPDLIVLATVYASFATCGYANRRLHRLIGNLHQTDACAAIEFPKWRRLDVCHAMASLGGSSFPPDALEGTWISHRPEPWLISDDAAYAVTHEIFYATDYGADSAAVPGEVRDYLRLWLPAWFKIYARLNNYDLFAEFLMVSAYLRLHDCYAAHVGELLQQQAQEGFFPGPPGSAANIISPKTQIPRANFLRNYHTTLVSMLALHADPGLGD